MSAMLARPALWRCALAGAVLLTIALLVTACRDGRPHTGAPAGTTAGPAGGIARDTAARLARAATPAARSRAIPGSDTVQWDALQWTVGAVDSLLQDAGIAPVRDAGIVRQPFLSVTGRRLVLPGGELQLYIYGDAAARGRDTDPLDSARAAPQTSRIRWRAHPTLILNNNLAGILLTDDTTLAHRVLTALGRHGTR